MISALDFERAVVAAAIAEQNQNTIDVIQRLDPVCFESPFCKALWETIRKLHKQNEPIDEITVGAQDEETYPMVCELVRNTPVSPASVKVYAKKVRQAYNLRNAAEKMQVAINAINSCNDIKDIGKAAEEVEKAFSDIVVETDHKMPRSGAEILPDYMDMIERRNEGHESELTIKTGIDQLDEMLGGFNPVDLVVLGGCSGMGKTELANKIANGVVLNKRAVLNFTMEMDEFQIIERSVSGLANVPSSCLRNPRGMNSEQWGKVSSAMGELNNDLYWVHDEGQISVESVCSHARYIKNVQPKLSLIIVDYAQIMATPNADRHDLAIGKISMRLKALAKEIRCPILLLSQLNEKQIKSRMDKRPMNADLKDSAALINDADRILLVYRDDVYHDDIAMKGIAEIIVGKNRFGERGTVYQGWSNGHFIDIDVNEVARMVNLAEQEASEGKKGKFGDIG